MIKRAALYAAKITLGAAFIIASIVYAGPHIGKFRAWMIAALITTLAFMYIDDRRDRRKDK